MNQLLKGLQDVDATNMEIKNYLQIFKKVLDKGIIKTSQNKTQWDDALSNKISQLGEEFHLLNYLQTRSNTEGFKVRNIDISENQRLSHLRWKVVEFLKLLS